MRILERFEMPSGRSPGEHQFKLAVFDLFLRGIYPSGRQVYNLIGRDPVGRVNLNGRQCRWKAEMFELLGIEPYTGYMKRTWRPLAEGNMGYEVLWRRRTNGLLEYVGPLPTKAWWT